MSHLFGRFAWVLTVLGVWACKPAPVAFVAAPPPPPQGLSQVDAAALLKAVDTVTCDKTSILDLNDYGAAPTRTANVERALTSALQSDSSFVVASHQDRSTGSGETVRVFNDEYRTDEDGHPVTFTYWVSEGNIFNESHDMVRLNGCLYVPDRIEVLDTRLSPEDKDAVVTYRRYYRASKLMQLLAGPKLHYTGFPAAPPVQEHVAKLTKLDATGWRVSQVDDSTITYN